MTWRKKYAWISIGMWTLVKQPKLYKVDIFSNVNEHALNMNESTENSFFLLNPSEQKWIYNRPLKNS